MRIALPQSGQRRSPTNHFVSNHSFKVVLLASFSPDALDGRKDDEAAVTAASRRRYQAFHRRPQVVADAHRGPAP